MYGLIDTLYFTDYFSLIEAILNKAGNYQWRFVIPARHPTCLPFPGEPNSTATYNAPIVANFAFTFFVYWVYI